jgi:hypothetical protein
VGGFLETPAKARGAGAAWENRIVSTRKEQIDQIWQFGSKNLKRE